MTNELEPFGSTAENLVEHHAFPDENPEPVATDIVILKPRMRRRTRVYSDHVHMTDEIVQDSVKLNNLETRHPLLNYQQEQFFFRQGAMDLRHTVPMDTVMSHEGYKAIMDMFSPPDRERAEEIAHESQFLSEYLERMNVRLIKRLARRYMGNGLDFLDLVQEGYFGLKRAVKGFNPQKKKLNGTYIKFSTYAFPEIKKSLLEAIEDHGSVIRVTSHGHEAVAKEKKALREREDELGRSLTYNEQLVNLQDRYKKQTAEYIARELTSGTASRILSLDVPVNTDSSKTLADRIPSQQNEYGSVLQEAFLDSLSQKLLKNLTQRERDVINLRFGFGDGRSRTQRETADELKISRVRVQQLENQALTRLRLPQHADVFRSYFEDINTTE